MLIIYKVFHRIHFFKDEYSPFIGGHQVYYNFIRLHESLFAFTPAEIANIDLNLGHKKWEKLLIQSVKNMKRKYYILSN